MPKSAEALAQLSHMITETHMRDRRPVTYIHQDETAKTHTPPPPGTTRPPVSPQIITGPGEEIGVIQESGSLLSSPYLWIGVAGGLAALFLLRR
jgi:hypothetical protein